MLGTAGTLSALRRVPELEVKELDSGCCGMAGSFGYERGHYEVSEALRGRVLIPAALADPTARLVAPGFSCRSQVHGLAGIKAVHPIEVLAEQLAIRSDVDPRRVANDRTAFFFKCLQEKTLPIAFSNSRRGPCQLDIL